MKPPFTLTEEILSLSLEIATLVGRIEGMGNQTSVDPYLRKQNQIKTIHSNLAIEGNTLSMEQVTAILEGKTVKGNPKEILEVRNAILLYNQVSKFSKHSLTHFKKAHSILMKGLVKDAGKFRGGHVGIVKGSKLQHMAPKPSLVPKLMEDLFQFIKSDSSPLLILSAVIHYEIEFIHPFSDGNGRMGRFWQHLMLVAYNPIFKQIPFETIIKEEQKKYYKVLSICDKKGESTPFILFSLQTLLTALLRFEKESTFSSFRSKERLNFARTAFRKQLFSRKDYILLCKTISSATASRDLKQGVDEKTLKKSGEKSKTLYRFL